jgi:hypothetical protein
VTKPRHPAHLVGFSGIQDRTADTVREHGRYLYLTALAKVCGDVLVTLEAVPAERLRTIDRELENPDPTKLREWAGRWGLNAEWCLAPARSTWAMWRLRPNMKHTYWCPRDDGRGRLYKPRPGRQADQVSVSPAHLVWLARFQTGEAYASISADRTRGMDIWPASGSWSWPESSRKNVSTVREACIALAKFLGLP